MCVDPAQGRMVAPEEDECKPRADGRMQTQHGEAAAPLLPGLEGEAEDASQDAWRAQRDHSGGVASFEARLTFGGAPLPLEGEQRHTRCTPAQRARYRCDQRKFRAGFQAALVARPPPPRALGGLGPHPAGRVVGPLPGILALAAGRAWRFSWTARSQEM